MHERGRIRDLFLAPLPAELVARPTREELKELPLMGRRKRRIEYAAQGGLFRTWVYVVALITVVGGFTLLVVISG